MRCYMSGMAQKSPPPGYRSEKSGRFVTTKYGEGHPKTTKEAAPNPGRGDTSSTYLRRDAKSGEFLTPASRPGNITQGQADRIVREIYRKK